MPAESLFLTLSQVGIACAGFASVVAALRGPKDSKDWEPREVMGLRTMVEYGLAAMLGGCCLGASFCTPKTKPWFGLGVASSCWYSSWLKRCYRCLG